MVIGQNSSGSAMKRRTCRAILPLGSPVIFVESPQKTSKIAEAQTAREKARQENFLGLKMMRLFLGTPAAGAAPWRCVAVNARSASIARGCSEWAKKVTFPKCPLSGSYFFRNAFPTPRAK